MGKAKLKAKEVPSEWADRSAYHHCPFGYAQGRLLGVPEKPWPARILGLDEFSIKKGQVYDTAIMDIQGTQILGVVSGHRQEEVQGFLEHLPEPERVKVVVMDMREPFRKLHEAYHTY